mgnify:CR=1 FL=1
MTMFEFVKDLNLAVIVLFAALYLYQGFYAVVGLVCRRWQDRHQPSRLHRQRGRDSAITAADTAARAQRPRGSRPKAEPRL